MPVQFKLLITLLLGVMVFQSLSLTTIRLSSSAQSGKRAGSKYMVNCACMFCSADHESVVQLLIVKLINHQLINK